MADAELALSWQWDGLQELSADLDRMAEALKPDRLTAIMADGADKFVDAVRVNVHSETGYGTLQASIGKVELGSEAGWSINPFVHHGEAVHLYAATQETGQTHVPVKQSSMRFEYKGSFWDVSRVTIPGMGYMSKGFAEGVDAAYHAVEDRLMREFDG